MAPADGNQSAFALSLSVNARSTMTSLPMRSSSDGLRGDKEVPFLQNTVWIDVFWIDENFSGSERQYGSVYVHGIGAATLDLMGAKAESW